MSRATSRPQVRFGIGEWYGKSFVELPADVRAHFAEVQSLTDDKRPQQECPFLTSREGRSVPCWKRHGICSIRKYKRLASGQVVVSEDDSSIRTVCPSRFEEGAKIYGWIGDVLLSDPHAAVLGQVPFLERVPQLPVEGTAAVKPREVGRIDNIMVVPESDPLRWCAVEKQAVYFSGRKMGDDFDAIITAGKSISFPARVRRPDYRSSSTKRLMPQLQIKVPTLSRWGKKMAVVVDRDFFSSMGSLRTTKDLSNCDIAWFVVKYGADLRLMPDEVYFTRLADSVEALVAGDPVSLPRFEERILDRLKRIRASPTDIPADE